MTDKKNWAWVLILASLVCVVLAAYRTFTKDELFLAGTQWLQVASVLGIYGVFLRLEA